MHWCIKLIVLISFSLLGIQFIYANSDWVREWPNTDFSKHIVDFSEIISGGPTKDGIPAIDSPQFKLAENIKDVGDNEPIISVTFNNQTKAYPIRLLIYHEIVNDSIGGLPISVTYCPLCNSSLVFIRKVDDLVLDFGTTGKLRYSNLIMYDRQTESWWEQFTGRAIVGKFIGKKLSKIPAQIESFSQYCKKHKNGKVLVANKPKLRPYGNNPYRGYDQNKWPFLFQGNYQGSISPLARVVAIEDQAWPLSVVRENKTIKFNDLIITWQKGQNSALDHQSIKKGRDIGTVYAYRVDQQGRKNQIPYQVPFAFVFNAFFPNGKIHDTP